MLAYHWANVRRAADMLVKGVARVKGAMAGTLSRSRRRSQMN